MASSASGEILSASSASATALSGCESSSTRVGHQFVRFHELRIEFHRLGGPFHGLAVKAVRADQRQAQIGRRILGSISQRFLEEIFRIGVVEPLVQQPAPAHAVIGVGVRLRHRGAEFVVGLL